MPDENILVGHINLLRHYAHLDTERVEIKRLTD